MPLLSAYDYEERVWNPPSPLLFQWDRGRERSRMSGEFIRSALGEVLAFIGLTDSTGQPLVFAPHDFRRLFITDAIRSGLPPHIAQVIAGYANINTTMGYNAICPEETIEAHRAFITRRRAAAGRGISHPTDGEWEDFLGHFERRKLSVGTPQLLHRPPLPPFQRQAHPANGDADGDEPAGPGVAEAVDQDVGQARVDGGQLLGRADVGDSESCRPPSSAARGPARTAVGAALRSALLGQVADCSDVRLSHAASVEGCPPSAPVWNRYTTPTRRMSRAVHRQQASPDGIELRRQRLPGTVSGW
ncbi:tyrosine-type recombinase/integrase [Streptomyces sp. NPDC001102]